MVEQRAPASASERVETTACACGLDVGRQGALLDHRSGSTTGVSTSSSTAFRLTGMRAVVQRVTRAEVTVVAPGGRSVVGAIDRPGLLVLVGVTHDDGAGQAGWLARKIAGLRILRDEQSVTDVDAPVLVVSQFTLYGDARKGRRPTWQAAAPGHVAEPVYESLCEELAELGVEVHRGAFGADMAVSLVNDGPVTLVLESP